MVKKYWKIILPVVLIVVAAVIIKGSFFKGESERVGVGIAPHMVMEVQKGGLRKTVSASGYIEPAKSRDLYFKISGTVLEVNVKEGERVEEGERLFSLENRKEKLNLLKAENSYKRALINGTESEIEEAKLNLEIAREEMAATEIKAPFSGIVIDVLVEEGDYVSAGNVVATIIDPDGYMVEVGVEEADILDLKAGQKALVTLDALPGVEIEGRVAEIAARAQSSSGVVTLPVKVLLEEKDYPLKPGFSANVEIIVGEEKNLLVVPVTAIINLNGREMVIKVENEKPNPVPVKTGLSDGLRVAVESGLKEGDKILINAAPRAEGLSEGQGPFGVNPGSRRIIMPRPGTGRGGF